MQIIENTRLSSEPLAREYGWLRAKWERVKLEVWHWRFKRWLPRLVWLNDELDVVVTLSQDKLNPEDGLEQLFRGAFFEAEKIFLEMGITFDTGMGCYGRDWQWDWSLKGPINVRYRGRAKHPELRKERSRPHLVK